MSSEKKESRKSLPLGNTHDLKRLQSWLDELKTRRDLSTKGEGTYSVFPKRFLVVLSIVSGFRKDPEDSESFQKAKEWKDKVEAENNGVFDPVVLYDLMGTARKENP